VVAAAEAAEVGAVGGPAVSVGDDVVGIGPADALSAGESVRGAVPGLLPVRFPGPLTEPDVRLSSHPALHRFCRQAGMAALTQGLGILFPR
jgi:hypothetical protein